MFKGSLDYVDDKRVAGWAYSDEVDLRGRRILAFVGGQCIGTGDISVHRADLEQAGLGDGTAGFGFRVTIPSSAAPNDVYVKLEASDFILAQRAWLKISARAVDDAGQGLL